MVDQPHADPLPRSERPAHVTIAAGILIVAGAFVALVGAAVLVIGIVALDPSSLPSWADVPPAGLSSVAAVVGVGVAAYGIGQMVTGIGVLRAGVWARVAGIALAAIGAALAIAGVLRVGSPEGAATTLVFVPVAAAYGYAIWAFATNVRWFRDR